MNGIEQLGAISHRTLEGFTARYQARSAGALVDDSRHYGVLEVVFAGCATAINEAGAAHVAINNLIAAEIDRVVGGEFGVNALVELAVARGAGVEGLEAGVIFRKFLFDDVRFDGAAEVVRLAGEISRDMVVFIALHIEGGIAQVAPEDGGHAELVGESEGLGDFYDLAVGVIRAKVDRGSNGRRAHVRGCLHFAEQDFLKGVRVGEEFVVVDLNDKGNLVRVFARDGTQNAKGRSDSVATAFDREFDDIFRIKIGRVFCEAGARGVLDALIYGEDGNISGAGKAAGIVDPLEIIQNALVPVCVGENAIHKIRARQMEHVFGDGLGCVVEEVVGLVAESRGDGVDHVFFC